MFKIFLTTILGVGLFFNVLSQHVAKKAQIIVGKNQLISFKYPGPPLVEPHLAVNPKNSKHMVAAAIVFDSAATSESRTHIVVFATKDNGSTWKQTDLPMTVGFDPWVAIKNDKDVALVALAGFGFSNRNGLVYYSSHDGGFTWDNDTVMLGGGHDHATLIVNPRKNDRLYVLSSLMKRDTSKKMISYAWLNYTDDWRTFVSPPSLYTIGPRNSNTLTVAVHPDGAVVLPYVEYSVENNQAGSPVFKYIYSIADKLSNPVLITDKAGLSKGFAVFAVDITGKYKGRMYFVKNSGTSSTRSNGLYIQYSDSIGGQWLPDIRIDHNYADEKLMRTAAIAINKDGIIGIVWVDRRNDPELKKNDIYFTTSVDGGQTFEKEVRVTGINSDPSVNGNGKAGERFISGGDYMGCAAKPDGTFQLLWADSRSGVFQLYTSNIKVVTKAVRK